MAEAETTALRRGDWMQTYGGRQYWPLDPRIEDVDIIDIAAALSKLCRYGGHCQRFYSVAEHAVLISRALRHLGYPARVCRAGLLHDGSEAYVADLIRPLKPHLAGYHAIEDANMAVIARRLGFDWPLPEIVKEFDTAILHDELRCVMGRPPADWKLPGDPLGVVIEGWAPDRAFREFMSDAALIGAA